MTDQTPMPEDQSKPRRRIGLRVLLFVSLALNMVILGVAGGAWLNFSRGEDHPRLIARDLGLGPYLMALEPQSRRQLEQAARSQRGKVNVNRAEWRNLYTETLEALRTDPFDADRLRVAIARQSELAARSREVGLEVMVSQLEAMSPEERAAFADRLEKGAQRGPAMHEGKRGEGKRGEGMRTNMPPPPSQ
ncbi:periplasmic heavy metal sensor [Aliiruegeria sabulilitoris]|uniref:periplasmic heavy metal sensor n=1 Tax=Aliiruegeria sabulilitoris TaxID=1510458 RepID=UPI00083658B7|nr:periplasmic heavy metal sensor [Aliiruegeria sabulilitoris]NDR59228.1 periplasmic heavy metal sensor [Pseudoruegeria sp. M32A2M]